jgi:hypothetical protein
MLDDVLDDRILNVRRIGHGDALFTLIGLEADWSIIEHREAYLPLGADNLNTILTS